MTYTPGYFFVKILLCLLLIAAPGQIIFAQTPAFTYQGRLTDGAQAANGTYQMEFRLFGSLAGNDQINSTITNNNVQVLNGIFTVSLDFGANAFAGADRFLEISVKKPAEPAFTTLLPRQQIGSSPYSVKTLSAAFADVAGDAQSVGGTPAAQIIKEGDARLTDSRTPAPGSGNYIQNSTAAQTGASFNITGTGTVNGFRVGSGGASMGGTVAMNDNLLSLRAGNDANHGIVWSAAVDGTEFRAFNGFRWTTGTAGANERMRLDSTGLLTVNTVSANTQFNIGADRVLSVPGSNNLFVGVNAGSITTGDSNVFLGTSSGLVNTSGTSNFFGGFNSGAANTIGTQNVFIGRASGFNNTEGELNVFLGRSAGFFNTTSDGNTYVGTSAGANMTGAGNVAVGYNAGFSATTGNDNVFVGTAAGATSGTGTNNTFIGAGTDGQGNLTNASALGFGTIVTRSNSVVLGNNANVGIGTGSPAAKLQVNGGDIYVGTTPFGVILRSPNGTCFRLRVSDTGVLATTLIVCPQ